MDDREGCLTAVLRIFGINLQRSAVVGEALPYRRRDDFLSAAERSFYGVLLSVLAGKAVVFAKVRVADLLYVPRGAGSLGFQNRISAKHVDFVLCAPDTLQPLAALELDDASHARSERGERDDFLNAAFQAAGLPLLRFAAQRQYDPRQLMSALEPVLKQTEQPDAVERLASSEGAPNCPKCGSEMILRTATKGSHRGQPFYGCPNYPQCRGTLKAE